MAQVIDTSESNGLTDGQSYHCETQEEEDPSYGPIAQRIPEGTTGESDAENPDKPDSLVVGFGKIVPRWDVTISGGTKIQYFVRADTFPSDKQVKIASANLKDAAASWNDLDLGLAITETTDEKAANFYLAYARNPSRGSGKDTLARAFFPHEINQDVIVYTKAFEDVSIMKNVFQHELGHVLGLRHEFAITGDAAKDLDPEGEGAVQYLEMNYNSIMSYNFPPRIQPSDREQVVKFYQLPKGYLMGTSPVTDFTPQIRQRNR